jgi:hypothetical protein
MQPIQKLEVSDELGTNKIRSSAGGAKFLAPQHFDDATFGRRSGYENSESYVAH